MIRKRHSVIVSSLIIALVLQIVPLPIQVDLYRPDWVLVVLSYWCMALPHRVNVGIAFVTGIAVDILVGTTLGIHSLSCITHLLYNDFFIISKCYSSSKES